MKSKQLDYDDLASFCAETALFLGAGLPAAESFRQLAGQTRDAQHKKLLLALHERLGAGASLYEAMEQTGAFPQTILHMVRIGQMTGRLEDVFSSLSAYCVFRRQLSRTIRSAVAYPLLLTLVMLAVFFVILTQVVPSFADVYAQLGATMTPLAGAFLRAGIALSAHWRIPVAVLALIALVAVAIALIPQLRRACAATCRRIFFHTRAGNASAAAIFANLVSLAYSGGFGFDEALTLAGDFFQHSSQQRTIEQCRSRMAAGAGFDQAAGEVGLLTPLYCGMLSAGIRTGKTERMLQQITARTQADAAAAIDRLVGCVEPVLVIVLSVLAGLLLLSVMLPLMGILSAL